MSVAVELQIKASKWIAACGARLRNLELDRPAPRRVTGNKEKSTYR